MPIASLWPPSLVRVVAGDLELRYLDDALLGEAADLAAAGVHDPDAMPFAVPWTRGTPEQVARSVLTYQWGARAGMRPDRWSLELAVVHQGVLVGLQGASTHDYPVLREAETGSWLGRQYQGRGIGTRMRVLMLHLLFDGLGAQSATTSAFEDNPASLAVTRTLGYADDGTQLQVREGVPARHHRFRMDRAVWEARPGRFRPDVAMSGVEELAVFLGVGD